MIAIFLCVFGLAFSQEYNELHALTGETVEFFGQNNWRLQPLYASPSLVGYDIDWSYRFNNESEWEIIGYSRNGTENCKLSWLFSNRVKSCDTHFWLPGIKLSDAGLYKANFTNEIKSEFLFFNMTVDRLSPVIVPLSQSLRRLWMRCVDSTSALATTRFVYKRLKTGKVQNNNHLMLLTQINPKESVSMYVKCCSKLYTRERCGSWVHILLDYKLCTEHAPNRHWCTNRKETIDSNGKHDINWFPVTRTGRRKETCLISRVGTGNSSVCYGNSVTLVSDKSPWNTRMYGGWDNNSDWEREGIQTGKWEVIGVNGTCLSDKYGICKSDMKIKKVGTHDLGRYESRDGNLTYNFNLTVAEPLGVNLELVALYPEYTELYCSFNYPSRAEIVWEINGTFEVAYKQGSQSLIIKPDCWYSNIYWFADVYVRCIVVTPEWKGFSSSFHVKNYRSGCSWKI